MKLLRSDSDSTFFATSHHYRSHSYGSLAVFHGHDTLIGFDSLNDL